MFHLCRCLYIDCYYMQENYNLLISIAALIEKKFDLWFFFSLLFFINASFFRFLFLRLA